MFYTLIKHEFYQSELTHGPIYILNSDKTCFFDQSEHAHGPCCIINGFKTVVNFFF